METIQNKEPDSSIVRQINDNDTVAGWVFRKFLNDYKEYDAAQKKIIEQQRARIEELENELAWYYTDIPKDDNCLQIKLRECNKEKSILQNKLCKLKNQITKMSAKLSKKNG